MAHNPWCKPCNSIYKKAYYIKNKIKLNAYSKVDKKKRKDRLRIIYLAGKDKPCADCGYKYSYWIMQYDHLSNKLSAIPRMVSDALSEVKLVAEIAKCDVVCANCHADRTFKRRLP